MWAEFQLKVLWIFCHEQHCCTGNQWNYPFLATEVLIRLIPVVLPLLARGWSLPWGKSKTCYSILTVLSFKVSPEVLKLSVGKKSGDADLREAIQHLRYEGFQRFFCPSNGRYPQINLFSLSIWSLLLNMSLLLTNIQHWHSRLIMCFMITT